MLTLEARKSWRGGGKVRVGRKSDVASHRAKDVRGGGRGGSWAGQGRIGGGVYRGG